MNTYKHVLALLVFILAVRALAAQDTLYVMVHGTVLNQISGLPESYSVVHLLQGDSVRYVAPCDSDGWYGFRMLPAGSYRLEVQVRGQTLYQADLVLQQNAELNIGVITDSMRFVLLREVQVIALKHMLGSQYIGSPSDIRIWNLTGRKGGGDHWASVEISPDMEADWDELDDENKILRSLLPVGVPGKAYKFYLTDHGLNVSAHNSAMKNELLRKGRILDEKRSAPRDSIAHRQ